MSIPQFDITFHPPREVRDGDGKAYLIGSGTSIRIETNGRVTPDLALAVYQRLLREARQTSHEPVSTANGGGS